MSAHDVTVQMRGSLEQLEARAHAISDLELPRNTSISFPRYLAPPFAFITYRHTAVSLELLFLPHLTLTLRTKLFRTPTTPDHVPHTQSEHAQNQGPNYQEKPYNQQPSHIGVEDIDAAKDRLEVGDSVIDALERVDSSVRVDWRGEGGEFVMVCAEEIEKSV
jgi:hypothetical protein